MKKLNLCIDIDGTVTEAYDWIPRVNSYFHTTLIPKDVNVYEIYKVLGVEKEDYERFYRLNGEKMHEENIIRVGAKEVINALYKDHNY